MVANEENLIPINKRTKKEQREISSKGGKASGAARRRKRDLKSAMKMLLDLPAESEATKRGLKSLGVAEEDYTNRVALVSRAFATAMSGNVRAMEFIADISGETPRQKLEEKRFKAETQPQHSTTTENLMDAWFDSIPEDDVHNGE